MEPKHHKHQIPSSPLPNPPSSSSSLFRDISNFKTPKPQRQSQVNPSFNPESPCSQFFTALKQTPKSSYSSARRRPRFSLAAKKLKAVELEQSKSSRKTQTNKEKSLKSLAKSLTVWLNFLFENPRSCGVEVSRFTGEDLSDGPSVVYLGGKRDSVSHGGVEVDREWRGPKRRKDTLWVHKGEVEQKFSSSMYSRLQSSLRDVCSLDDMNERMTLYLSLNSCKEIFDVMTHVTKNIDEGRLQMKAHCPIVTDVGMKEKALKILMSYNPVWLRIGLYIIFGGESLLPKPNVDMNSEQEASFLKVVAEKLFFSHSGLAKAYVYNKLVDGLYRPGYYEKLGSVILKKFLLLALILDRAKSQSSLPISYGIDGVDGGSPSLFTPRTSIKSSCEVISDFLSSDVMHGVGNLLAHLTIIGYKVSYQQNPLVKYVFKVTDLFNDLQDGILLCRVIQLLQHDPSILKKVVVASDDRKKNLANCEISLQYLKQIGVPLCDEDGTEIITEDIVDGDKELIISLLWNMFVHLQLPLLINNKLVSDEIIKIRGPEAILPNTSRALELLLEWIKAICENYDLMVENFSSLVDGKAMWCLLDYYFRKEHCDDRSNKDLKETSEVSIVSTSDYVDAVHNFLLSQKLTTLLGNFPEVLQVSDILEYKGACNDRGVIILLVFLSSQLIVKRNLQQINFHKLLGHNQNSERKCSRRDRFLGNHEGELNVEDTSQNGSQDNGKNFKAIMAWWKEMAQHNGKANVKQVFAALHSFTGKQSSDNQRENAAKIIQSHFRRSVEHYKYTRIKKAVSFLQAIMRVWLMVKNTPAVAKNNAINIQELLHDETKVSDRFSRYLVDRHAFIKRRRSVVIIQRAIRYSIAQRRQAEAAIMIQKCIRGYAARSIYFCRIEERARIACHNQQQSAATIIQTCFRSWVSRKCFLNQKQAATRIQSHYRGKIVRKSFLNQKQAATKIQSRYRGKTVRKSFVNLKQAATKIQSHYRGKTMRKSFVNQKQAATRIQSHYLGKIARKSLVNQRQAATRIQSHYRGKIVRKSFLNQKQAATTIQSRYRGWMTRSRFLKMKQAATRVQSHYRGWLSRNAFLKTKQAAMKLQRLYRFLKCLWDLKHYKLEIKSAVTIQSHARGWIARRVACRHRCLIELIQSVCRGWLARREFLLKKEAATRIQSAFRRFKCFKVFNCYKDAAFVIQQSIRGCITRRRLIGVSFIQEGAKSGCNHDGPNDNHDLNIYAHSASKLQRWWRGILLAQRTKTAIVIQSGVRGWIARRTTAQRRRTKAAILIQSCVRGWIARRTAAQRRHRIAVVQSYWKGYIERKHSRGKISDIRMRVQKSAANVDDGMRIINRLIAALSELNNLKSVSGILHTCATLGEGSNENHDLCEKQSEPFTYERVLPEGPPQDLNKKVLIKSDMATKHSQKCCEKLVAVGAIDTLLGLTRSISRSIVDQQVLRHVLSIFRNLTRHPHLTQVLIDSHKSSETILWEFLRNKEDSYFIAADVLRSICLNKNGVGRLRELHALVKRLHNLVEDLKRKAGNEKRNPRTMTMNDRRLKEAAQILKMITNG